MLVGCRCSCPAEGSDSEIGGGDFGIATQRGTRSATCDSSNLQHVAAIGDGERRGRILLDQQDGDVVLLQRHYNAQYLLDDQRSETHRWLVEKQHPWARHECAANREHLL